MKKALSLLLVMLMVIGMFAACAPADNSNTTVGGDETTVGGDETTVGGGDETTVGESETPLRFTWHQAQGTNTGYIESPYKDVQSYLPWVLWDSLADADGLNLNYYKLAEEITANEDFTEFTIKMAEDRYWQDGEVLDHEDVLWTLLYLVKKGGAKSSTWKYIKGIEAYCEDTTGEVELEGIYADEDGIIHIEQTQSNSAMLATLYGHKPFPEHALKDVENWADVETADYFKKPFGSGPYKIVETSYPDYVTMTRWDDYYGEKPGIKNLKFISYEVGGATAIALALATGAIDFADMMSMTEKSNFDMVIDSNPDIRLLVEETTQFRGFVYNLDTRQDGKNKAALQNAGVRRAIASAFDTEGIIECMGGDLAATDALMPVTQPEYKAGLDTGRDMSADDAKKLLSAGGWKADDVLNIAYYYTDQMTVDAMDYIVQCLAEIGVKAEAKLMDTTNLAAEIYTLCNYDLIYLAMTSDSVNNANVYSQMTAGHSYTFMYNKDGDLGKAIDAKYSPVYDQYIAATGEKKLELSHKLQEMSAEDCYIFAAYVVAKAEGYNTTTVSLPEDAFKRSWAGDKKWHEWKMLV